MSRLRPHIVLALLLSLGVVAGGGVASAKPRELASPALRAVGGHKGHRLLFSTPLVPVTTTTSTTTSTTTPATTTSPAAVPTTTTPTTTVTTTTAPTTPTTTTTTTTTSTTTSTPPASLSTGLWSASSFLNTPISNFVASPNSSTWLNMLSSSETYGLWVDSQSWTAPMYKATSSTPTVTVAIANTGKHITIPYQSSFQPDPSGDSQLAVIDTTTGCEYEFQAFDPSTLTAHSEATFEAYTGTGIHANDAGVSGSNISVLGGQITPQDIASGSINHALRYATPVDAPTWVSPASRSDGSTNGGIPAGQLMRLDPSLDLTTLGLTPFQLMVAKALQKYGAYNADWSGSFKLYAESTVDGSTYSSPVSGLPWSVVSHLQFGSATLGSITTDSNSNPNCNEQH